MAELKLYSNYLEAEFLERPHRFLMRVLLNGKIVDAYVPNTGRLAEFLYPGRKFYLTRQKMPKYDYKVIGTEYQGNYVLIDTIKVNRIFQEILQQNVLKEFTSFNELKREVTYGSSKFDFRLTFPDRTDKIIEIKCCTLCHNGTAMFPDAPTARGQRHLKDLNMLAENHETWSVYLITNYSAAAFIPNYHIDYEYGRIFQQSSQVNFKALKIKFSDPVTLIPEQTREVPILFDSVERDCKNAGAYLLIMQNDKHFKKKIGALGEIDFKPGYYVYAGSAMKNLEQRIKRHKSVRKKIHWHIDGIIPRPMKFDKYHILRSSERLEEKLAAAVQETADGLVPEFGASDSSLNSHLFFFREDPKKLEKFSDIILGFRSV